MDANIAPIQGTTITYSELKDNTVLILKDNYNYFLTTKQAFDDLYYRLDESHAALKEDCMVFVEYYPDVPLSEYPDWYIEGYDNGMIFEDETGNFLFYDNDGDMAMAPGGLMLCNFLGQLRYMERNDFEKYYDKPIGGYSDEF